MVYFVICTFVHANYSSANRRTIGGEIVGNGEVQISGPAMIENAGPDHITFLEIPSMSSFMGFKTNASVVLVDKILSQKNLLG